MGISGLLPFLKDATCNVNIKQFEGSTVAVDTYCWIYRGAFSCAEQLALGLPADGHVKYVLRYVQKLLEWGIKPIMIFDGSCLPSKKNTELKRKESKEMYRKKAAQCLQEGRKNEARECFQRCIECTPKMALEVIKALHNLGVDVLVAPYEADAQLTFLSKSKIADIVITEDSDLVLFGCEKILYKLDINGFGQLIQKDKIISITQFDSADNFERFRWMCILSGCDYLENLPGIGLGKAKKLLKSINKSDIDYILKQMPKILKMPNLIITNEYVDNFKKADKTFKYQIVFDPLKRKLVSLHTYGSEIEANEDLTYAGFFYDDSLAFQHSIGNIDVNTREKVNDFDPDNWNYKPPHKYSNSTPPHMKSIWSKSYFSLKNSNPFAACLNKEVNKKNDLTAHLKKNLPNTSGLTKTISCKSLINKETILNQDTLLNKDNIAKRKFDDICSSKHFSKKTLEENRSSSCDNAFKENESQTEKRFKKSDIEIDLDNLLDEYSSNKYSQSSAESSSYFSSSAASKNSESPILNKTSEFSSQATNSQSSIKTSPKNVKDVCSVLDRLETDFKSSPVQNCQKDVLNSPIVTEKSSFLKEFTFKSNQKLKTESFREKIENEIKQNLIEKISIKSEINVENQINEKKDENITVNIIEDLETIEKDSRKSLSKQNSFTKTKTPNKKQNKKLPNNQNDKPITDFFSSFKFTKTDNLKLNK